MQSRVRWREQRRRVVSRRNQPLAVRDKKRASLILAQQSPVYETTHLSTYLSRSLDRSSHDIKCLDDHAGMKCEAISKRTLFVLFTKRTTTTKLINQFDHGRQGVPRLRRAKWERTTVQTTVRSALISKPHPCPDLLI